MNSSIQTGGHPEGPPQTVWGKAYQTVMTPINLIAFILSLYLVDRDYETRRSSARHSNSNSSGTIMLLGTKTYDTLFPPQLYQQQGPSTSSSSSFSTSNTRGGGETQTQQKFYYHSKQRKLMKMEAADALAMRNRLLAGLALGGLGLAWAVWHMARRVVAYLMM